MNGKEAMDMLHDCVYRVAKWPPDFDERPLNEAFRVVREIVGSEKSGR